MIPVIHRQLGFLLLSGASALACSRANATDDEIGSTDVPSAATTAKSLSGHRVEVVVVQPSRKSLRLTVPGEVEAKRDALLAAPLGGYIEKVHIEEGQQVKRGQILLSVDRATHAVRQERAKVELASAEREFVRTRTLAGSIPQAEIDAAEDRVKLVQASLKELALNASRALVVAPFSGVIVDINAEVGEVAAPGSPLLRVVQLSPAIISIALSDRDISLAQVGAKAKVYLDARSGAHEGILTSVSKAADLKTRSFEAHIEVPNEDQALLPGMIANVELDTANLVPAPTTELGKTDDTAPVTTTNLDALIISQDWLVTKPDGIGVFIEEEGKAKWRPVVLGEILRKQIVVKKGLESGDSLIIVGHRELLDGDQVLVHRRGTCCTKGRASFSD